MLGTLEKIAALRKAALFTGLSMDDLRNLSRIVSLESLPPDTVIFRERERGDTLYILTEGKVQIYQELQGKGKILAVLGEHSYFGEMALLDEEVRSASVKTLEPCTTLKIRRDDFREFLETYPDIAFELLRHLSLRIRSIQESRP